jgi:NADH dehydrogenase
MTHKIVVVGGGAGGLELATQLGNQFKGSDKASVTLVDGNLTHIWKPLLHEVAAGSLNATADELNYLAQAKWNHFSFQLGRMKDLNRSEKYLSLETVLDEDGKQVLAERTVSYDTLVIAVGSTSNDFGIQGAKEHCVFLDTRQQAERFHRKLLNAYLSSGAAAHGPQGTISVAIVGGGATGVELAAELRHSAQELSDYGLGQVRPENLNITLIEAGPRILPALPERISKSVHTSLEKLGVAVIVGASVSEITEHSLTTRDGVTINADLKVWAAGIRAPHFLKDIGGLETNNLNQLVVLPTLQSSRDESIFALGDCAACLDERTGRNVPPRAQAAHQQASLIAKAIKARMAGKPLPVFKYRDYGSLVSLSTFTAVGNLMGNFSGSVFLEGWLARMFYISLYRMHQVALHGILRTGFSMIGNVLGSGTKPRLKLH